MPPYRDTLDPATGLFETCARHTNRVTSRTLQYIYLCDRCARRLTQEALNERPPIYHGETLNGHCGLCNELTNVTLRQWFACGICWNVVLSYQKGFVAPRAVHDYWRAEIEQQFPDYHLVETEEVQLVPYAPGGKTKKDAAADLDHLDFLVSERHGAAERPLFHIELKTGPSSIEAMKEFQLDVNDSNDIAGAVNLTQLPAYIFHVQVDFEYDPPPTRKGVARGVWWTDVVTLGENLKEVKARRGEDKKAGYYHTAAFQPIATFADELTAKRFEQLQVRVRQVPLELLGA